MNKTIKKINIGVVGAGHLGKYHVKHLKSIESFNIIGFHDTNGKKAESISAKYRLNHYKNFNKLLEECDAVSIVTPTETHFDIGYKCIQSKKHVFIEKPITKSVEDAEKLIQLAKDMSVIIQVGHIERFNPALIPLNDYTLNPKYIEIQRLAPYNIRGTDVPVVLDKMIHDLDIILRLMNEKVVSLSAVGSSIQSQRDDIANVQIVFENGCIANLIASRVTQSKIRTLSISQPDSYITLDYGDQELRIQRKASSEHQISREDLKYREQSELERLFVHKDNPLRHLLW